MEFLEARVAEDDDFATQLRDSEFLTEAAYAIGLEYAVRLRLDAAANRRILAR